MRFLILAVLLGCRSLCLSQTPDYDMTIRILAEQERMEVSGVMLLPPRQQPLEKIELALSENIDSFEAELQTPPMRIAKTEKKLRPWSRSGYGTNTWTLTPEAVLAVPQTGAPDHIQDLSLKYDCFD